jgi:hypothetical protein
MLSCNDKKQKNLTLKLVRVQVQQMMHLRSYKRLAQLTTSIKEQGFDVKEPELDTEKVE